MPKPARIAVVGAGGFLGSHVVRALREAGHDVLTVPREALTGGSNRVPWLPEGGIPVTTVINCAGATHGTPDELHLANVDLVATLLDRLSGRGIDMIQLGSGAEYGAGPPGEPASEDREARPTTPYGITKLAATNLVLDAARARVVPGTVLRIFNPVGAGISPELLPGRAAALIRMALDAGGPVRLGPLGGTRDFVDARDVADAVVAASLAGDATAGVINVGSGSGTTARALVALLAEVATYSGPILEADAGTPRPDEIEWQVADISRARAILGWQPRRSLRDAVGQLWAGFARSSTT
jgi:nucleoside-diphosphate-sugar epimerase